MTVTSEHELTSIGMLACRTQRPVQTILETAVAIGLQAAFSINGTIYFDRHQVQQLTEAMSKGGRK